MPYIRPSTILEARWRSTHFPLDDYAYEKLNRRSGVASRTDRRITAKAG